MITFSVCVEAASVLGPANDGSVAALPAGEEEVQDVGTSYDAASGESRRRDAGGILFFQLSSVAFVFALGPCGYLQQMLITQSKLVLQEFTYM